MISDAELNRLSVLANIRRMLTDQNAKEMAAKIDREITAILDESAKRDENKADATLQKR